MSDVGGGDVALLSLSFLRCRMQNAGQDSG
jgi:hypothetical protein